MDSSTLFSLHSSLGQVLTSLCSASGGVDRKIIGMDDYYDGNKKDALADEMEDNNKAIKDYIDNLYDIQDRIYRKAVLLAAEEEAKRLAAKAAEAIEDGVEWVGDRVLDGAEWVGDRVDDGVKALEESVDWVKDQIGID